MPLSNYALDKFVGHRLSELTECNAPDLTHLAGSRLDNFILNSILRVRIKDPERQYIFNFLRRVEAALQEYNEARIALDKCVRTDISTYFHSVFHFEVAISQIYQASMLLRNLLKLDKLFVTDDGSIVEKVNKIYNLSKHMDGTIKEGNLPESATMAIWITNSGIECNDAKLTFDEIEEMFTDLAGFADTLQDPPVAHSLPT